MLYMLDQQAYDGFVQVVTIMISLVFGFYTYLFLRLSRLTKTTKWRSIFRGAAIAAAVLGGIRLVVVFYFYEDSPAKMAIPVTALIAWAAVGAFGYLIVHWAEQSALRLRARPESIQLFDAITDELIDPLLNGQHVPHSKLVELQAQRQMLDSPARAASFR